ncbi:glycosyl transferase [Nostoc linckia z18]|uniref:Glycosyl transferase n=2 Tax=Nostoc linckia TaxID=92942 RepID=A0A9Q5ZFJ2_NOSLI|nr:glycosyltransferase family 2 protein [Nostoc linckia]PHK27318.1 glycosyl transferase [Nostoc linckia z15]PHJ67542.1 glycosyl transferase [Nostoc linckia z1]PHJ72567.1 glycosyl transferase [Nostoc linckia z3]PHJ74909.1 glycosyl transferase [Nostoc linckia z2]PHJ85066.1 glycosyl transferase [Nostoc linckia z4]
MNTINFTSSPEVSVILATYNREKYLNNCIDSIINQTFDRWELIVVDDGSQDNTFTVVNDYLQKFHNIRYLKHQNRKAAYSRNAGIQASFGNYITFIDSDDTYKINHLKSRWEYMQANPEIDLIEGGYEIEEEFFVADCFKPGEKISIRECVVGGTFFGKRKVFWELKGFNNVDYGEDAELWSRAEKIFKTQKIKEPETYIYTRTETSTTKIFMDKIS